LQITSAESQGRAQSEVEPFFDKSRAQHSGDEIGADSKRLESRTQSWGGDASVQASHHPNRRIRQRHDHTTQVVRRNADITVIDQQDFMACRRQHLCQRTQLAIGTQVALANQQINLPIRILRLQLANRFDRRVIGIADAEDQLKFRIVLLAVTAKRLPDLRIDSLQRFQDRDRWKCQPAELS